MLLFVIFASSMFLPFTNQQAHAAKKDGYEFILKVFFPDLSDSEYELVEPYIKDPLPNGELVGGTDTIGIGYQCDDTDVDEYGGPICDDYFVLLPSSFEEGGEITFHNVNTYLDIPHDINFVQLETDGTFTTVGAFTGEESVTVNDNSGLQTIATDMAATTRDRFDDVDPPRAEPLGDVNLNCEANKANLVFKWLLCPLVSLMFESISWLYNTVFIPLLQFDIAGNPDDGDPDTTTNDEALFNVWNSFRIIANILFIIVFLLAIMGQTFSLYLTAYELKKILPRLVIGAIAVQLSWVLVGVIIDIFNVIGAGVYNLILTPVRGFNTQISFDLGSVWQEVGSAIGLVGAGVAVYLNGAVLSGIPMILLPILIALIMTVVVLIARRILLILLIVTAPVAFVAWILPNTEGIAKKWWGYLWKALVIYPLLIALVAAGELFARMTVQTQTNDTRSVFTSIVGLIGFFAPYFMVPALVRFLGGFLAALDGTRNNLTRRLDSTLFGDPRDPNSRRGQRLQKQNQQRQNRKGKLIRHGYGGRRTSWLTKPLAYTASRFGDYTTVEALRREEAMKEAEEIYGTGPDDLIYAVMFNCHNPISGKPVADDACKAAQGMGFLQNKMADPHFAAASLAYAVRKAGGNRQIQNVRQAFFDDNYKNPGLFSKLGRNASFGWTQGARQAAKNDMWGQVTQMHEFQHPDLQDRNASGQFIGDHARYLNKINGRGSYGLNNMRESGWDGINDILGDYYERDAATGEFLRTPGPNGKLVARAGAPVMSDRVKEQLQILGKSMDDYSASGGAYTAREAAQKTRNNLYGADIW